MTYLLSEIRPWSSFACTKKLFSFDFNVTVWLSPDFKLSRILGCIVTKSLNFISKSKLETLQGNFLLWVSHLNFGCPFSDFLGSSLTKAFCSLNPFKAGKTKIPRTWKRRPI
jgi:hypothetical protein